MNQSRIASRAVATVVAMMLLAHPGSAAAQKAAAAKASLGTVPRMADGHPDLSGVWWPGQEVPVTTLRVGNPSAEAPNGQPRQGATTFSTYYQPGPAAKAKTLGEKDDPALRCIPAVIGPHVSLTDQGLVGQIIQSPGFVVLLTETYHSFKIVPTDGRPHREDVAPSYRGDSVGHWEGDTLVVDTTNFNSDNWILDHGNVSFHSDALHLVERYHRVDAVTLDIDARVEDPKMLTQPWTLTTQRLVLAPFDQIMEVACTNTETASLMESAAKDNYGRK